jgi:threonine aldolase
MIQIDLRSDTVTKPSQAMREYMFSAEVGDDVYGEDPTANALETRVAKLLGKEAAVYVPSGTMSNQIALKTHTYPGQEIILEESCHIYNFEAGGSAFHSQLQVRPLSGKYGILDPHDILEAIRPNNMHVPPTGLITLENTHNTAGGIIYPIDKIQETAEIAHDHHIPMHLDGARLMNAVVETGISAKEYARYFNSISLCFSKGLGAPVGSALAGDIEFIRKARRYRKIFGGAMRQIGILAAACLFALDHNVQRLKDDHRRTKRLAQGLAAVPGIRIDLEQVQTNMVVIHIQHPCFNAFSLSKALLQQGLAANALDAQKIRAVVHLDIDDDQIEKAIKIFQEVLFT